MNNPWRYPLVLASLLLVSLIDVSHIPRAPVMPRPSSQTAQAAGGSTAYYVSSAGSDSNAGTSDAPWQTFDRAFDRSRTTYLHGGDTLYLRSGIYRTTHQYLVSDNQFSGSPGQPTRISSAPGERASLHLSARVDSGWKKYAGGSGASIWYVDWSQTSTEVPQVVAVDGGTPTMLQEVNSAKNANPGDVPGDIRIVSVRTNQDDMIAGDFYYESDTASPNHGRLYIALPNGSDPNGQPIEVALGRPYFRTQHDIVISNLDIRYGNGGFSMDGHDNTYDSVNASYNGYAGIIGLCTNCIVRNSVFSHNGNEGSGIFGPHTLYENNTFDANNARRYIQWWGCGGMKQASLGTSVPSSYGTVIRGNTFKNTIDCPGLWFDNTPGGYTIENNRFINNGSSDVKRGLMIEISSGSAGDPIVVRNNIFVNNGMYVSASDYVYIYNNVFDGGGVVIHGLEGASRLSVSNNRVISNIFYNASIPVFIAYHPPAPYHADNNVSDYNLFYGPSMVFGNAGGDLDWNNGVTYSAWQARGLDTHSVVGNPLFANAAGGDYTPQAGSPALSAGQISSYVATDIRGTARNGVNDIGAYQVSTAPVTPPAPTTNPTPPPTVTPTPVPGPTVAPTLTPPAPPVPPPNPLPAAAVPPHAPVVAVRPATYAPAPTVPHAPASPLLPTQITRNLTLNDHGEDVRLLQRILNALGYTVSSSGQGSAGKETLDFGATTAQALMNYQAERSQSGIKPTGALDNATLTLINADIRRVLFSQESSSSTETTASETGNWFQRFIRTIISYAKTTLSRWVK